MMSKWFEGNIPGTIAAKPIRDGKILLLAKNKEVARKAIRNGQTRARERYSEEAS
jgi:hypothetical protein